MANEDPIKTRLETRLVRMGMARRLIAALEVQRQEIEHRLDQVPGRTEEQFRSIIDNMQMTLEELYGYIDREFDEIRRERWPARKE